jgi:hypothetical protein
LYQKFPVECILGRRRAGMIEKYILKKAPTFLLGLLALSRLSMVRFGFSKM